MAEPTAGGLVLEPDPGLYENVFVFDFQSLYPSLIRTFGLDPLSRQLLRAGDEDALIAPNGVALKRGVGILPEILVELFPRRQAAKKSGDEVVGQL